MQFDPIQIMVILGILALFYLMMIRPQQKRAKEQQNLLENLKPGDRVMTVSGIVGTVQHLGDKQAVLAISPGVEMTVIKAALSTQPVEDEFEYDHDGADDSDAEDTSSEDTPSEDTASDDAATDSADPTK